MRKKFSILFILMMVGQIFLSSFGMIAEALQNDKADSVFSSITYLSDEGEKIGPEAHEGDTTVEVVWSLKNQDIQAGDSETKQLAAGLILSEQQGNLVFEQNVVGTYFLTTDGKLTLAFNEEAEGSNAEGVFSIQGTFPVVEEELEAEEIPVVEEETEEAKREEDTSKEIPTVVDEDEETEEEIQEETEEDNQKETEVEMYAAEEKHGFTLELGAVTDLDGNKYTEEHLLDPKDEFYLDLVWDLENGHTYKAGDTETFRLPQGIKIQEEIKIDLKDDTGLTVAHVVVKTDGIVKLTFTDYVETHSNVIGHMQLVSKIDEENAEVEDGDIVLKPIGDEGAIRIPVDLGERDTKQRVQCR